MRKLVNLRDIFFGLVPKAQLIQDSEYTCPGTPYKYCIKYIGVKKQLLGHAEPPPTCVFGYDRRDAEWAMLASYLRLVLLCGLKPDRRRTLQPLEAFLKLDPRNEILFHTVCEPAEFKHRITASIPMPEFLQLGKRRMLFYGAGRTLREACWQVLMQGVVLMQENELYEKRYNRRRR